MENSILKKLVPWMLKSPLTFVLKRIFFESKPCRKLNFMSCLGCGLGPGRSTQHSNGAQASVNNVRMSNWNVKENC